MTAAYQPNYPTSQNQQLTRAEEAAIAAIAAYLATGGAVAAARLPAVLVSRLVALGLSRRAVRAAVRLTLAPPFTGVPTPPSLDVPGSAVRTVATLNSTTRALSLLTTAKRLTAATTPKPIAARHLALTAPATPRTAEVSARPPAVTVSIGQKPPSVIGRITPERGLDSPELSVVDELAAYFASPEAVDAGVLPVELANRLESLGLSKRAVRIAARLVLEPPLTGRTRWGSPGKAGPDAEVSAVRRVAGDEPTWRARYLLAAARRLTEAEQFAVALAKERRYLRLHRVAGINRRAGAARVDAVAKRAHGYLVWVAAANACPVCRPLDGQVFRVGNMPLPPIHPHCSCGTRPL